MSGIVVLFNVLKRDDSGQAGMTSKTSYPTFYDFITVMSQLNIDRDDIIPDRNVLSTAV
jgi:hypothetical protein